MPQPILEQTKGKAIRATKENKTMTTTTTKYYSRHEIDNLIANSVKSRLPFILPDKDNVKIAPYVVLALELIPKNAADWLLFHCCILGIDPKIEYIGSKRWTEKNLWGLCDSDDGEYYAISLSPDLFNQSEAIIVQTISHELAHAVLNHYDGATIEQEKAADNLVMQWLDDYNKCKGY